MLSMKAVTVTGWGDSGIQVTYQTIKTVEGYIISLTEMASPDNAEQFKRLQAIRVHDKFEVTIK